MGIIKKIRVTKLKFQTLFLLFCVIYMSVNVIINVTKCVSYRIKIAQIQTLHNKAQTKKEFLKKEINGYESGKKYEDFARNYLGYAEPNSIVVKLIDNPKPEPRYFAY